MNARPDFKAENTFEDVRQGFLDAGMHKADLLPLAPPGARLSDRSGLQASDIGKQPGRYLPRSGEWCGLTGRHFAEGLDPDTADDAADWPTDGLGIRARAFPAIDADVASTDAARLVERVLSDFAGWEREAFAVRTRSNSPRLLYAFAPTSPGAIRSRPAAVTFRMPGERETSTVEVLASTHWVASGMHPSGGRYAWRSDADFAGLFASGDLIRLTDDDVRRILDDITRAVEAAGGEIIGRADTRGGGASGKRRDWSRAEPMPSAAGLRDMLRDFPNTHANLSTYGRFVDFTTRLVAASGELAHDPEFVEDFCDWAVSHGDDFSEPPTRDWARAKWESFAADGVEHGQDALGMFLRDHGTRFNPAHDFPEDAREAMAECNRHIDKARAKRGRLLREVTDKFCFLDVNTATDDNAPRVRLRHQAKTEKPALAWWEHETTIPDEAGLIDRLRDEFGAGNNPRSAKDAFWCFQRALQADHPDAFYEGETIDPRRGFGELVGEEDGQGVTHYRVNTRALPEAQKLGAKLPKGAGDPDTCDDVRVILDFMRKMFGPVFDYERDTLAYMAQEEKRPGNMLLLKGDSGTGKSNYCDMLSLLFDGPRSQHVISGAMLSDEGASRFAWKKLEGARVLQLRELPEAAAWPKKSRAAFDSVTKQAVDASTGGDMVDIEGKGENAKLVHNFARIVAATNFGNAIEISAQDRRIFFVVNGITEQNRPPIEWWDDTLLPIIKSPQRLACFWRYLLDWNWQGGGYKPSKAPPMTAGKAEAQMGSIHNPYTRHAHAAVFVLQRAGRKFVDADEAWSLMRAAAHNEVDNGGVDDRRHYATRPAAGSMKEAFAHLQRHFPTVWQEFRDKDRKRLPTVYGAAGEFSDQLQAALKNEVLDALERDRRDHKLTPDDWPLTFRGPLSAPAKGHDDFD